MSNHLTPQELAEVQEMDRDEVLELCVRYGVPVLHGRIDKTLFAAQLAAIERGSVSV